MTRRALAFFLALALAGVGAAAFWQRSTAKRPAHDAARSHESTESAAAPATTPERGPAPRPVTAAAEPGAGSPDRPVLADARALDAYLASLVEGARRRGAVLEEDHRRGVEAIHSLTSQSGPRVTAMRVRRFGRELENVDKEIELRPLLAELDALIAQISASSDGPERGALIAQYRAKSQRLPELYRIGAEDRLRASTR